MGAKYMPETWVVRDRYAHGLADRSLTSLGSGREEFDRWLAHHEVHIAEQALRRLIADAGDEDSVPVRLIRARADRINAAQLIYRGTS